MSELPSDINIFGPNNHSKYEIGWRSIPLDLQTDITHLIHKYYPLTVINPDAIQEVDEWERQSNNFRISIKDDSGERSVLLHKQIKPRRYEDLIVVESLLDYLSGRGFSVPIAISTRDGDKVLSHPDGFLYRLFAFIEGNHYKGAPEELEDFAGNLASLHIALEQSPFYDQISRISRSATRQNPEGWEKLLESLERGDHEVKVDSIDELLNQSKGLILEASNQAATDLIQGMPLRRQVVRGDLHPLDTIYSNGKLRAFIDFDDVRVGELARDVANACHRFVRQFVVYQGRGWRETLPVGVGIFMQRYIAVNPLSPDEISKSGALISDEILNKLFSDIGRYAGGNPSYVIDGEMEKKLTLLREAELVGQEIQRQTGS